MKTRLSILLLFSTSFLNFALGKEYDGLVVNGNYKDLAIFISVGHNKWDLKHQDFHNTVKLRLLANGIKGRKPVMGEEPHVLVMNFNSLDNMFTFDVYLAKFPQAYIEDEFHLFGAVIRPEQGEYGWMGTNPKKSDIINSLNEVLDLFLFDYLESNISWREKSKLLIKALESESNNAEKLGK